MPDSAADRCLRAWQHDGDTEALDELLRLEMNTLKAMIQARNPGLQGGTLGATDAAQEAILALLQVRQLPHFESPRALRAYLWKAAWRLLQRRLERRGRRPQRLDASATDAVGPRLAAPAAKDALERQDEVRMMDFALELLRPDHRRVLELVYREGKELAEAAEVLGVSRDTAKMRLHRARRSLAEKVADWNTVLA